MPISLLTDNLAIILRYIFSTFYIDYPVGLYCTFLTTLPLFGMDGTIEANGTEKGFRYILNFVTGDLSEGHVT